MAKQLLPSLLIFICGFLHAQTYEISFSGSGSSTIVDSVVVQNLNQGASQKLGGNDLLVLNLIVGKEELPFSANGLTIFPNPFSPSCYVDFEATGSSQTTVEVLGIDGKIVVNATYTLLNGVHRLRVENLKHGIYFLRVYSQDFQYSGKIISLYYGNEIPVIQHEYVITRKKNLLNGTSGLIDSTRQTSLLSTFIYMPYNSGERLLFKGISGKYSTIISIIPDHSQVLDFLFVPCTDADSNHYSVVHIGNQSWMAENLKTTHYRNGDSIPHITDGTLWPFLSYDAYCNYDNASDSADTYGRLYNFYATKDIRKVAPAGWQVPAEEDFAQLNNYLGGNTVAGGKLKETGLQHWLTPNNGATNETGFTILPGGFRSKSLNGPFLNIGKSAWYWTNTSAYASYAFYYYVDYGSPTFYKNTIDYERGFSLRCIYGERPTVTTNSVTDITGYSLMTEGTVLSEGTAPVTERGFCWKLDDYSQVSPSLDDSHSVNGSGPGTYSKNISGLMSSNHYYVRAYAINSFGTSYGETIGVNTEYGPPFITLQPVTNITPYAATTGGSIDTLGGYICDVHGVCWNLNEYPTIVSDSHTIDGSGTGNYVSQITGLQPGKRYFARAYSTNAAGTVYSTQGDFTTPAVLATLTTAPISGYTFPTAVSGGNITNDGGDTITERGVCWSTAYPPTIGGAHSADGSGTGSFTSNITGTSLGTHYFVRAYATNSAGTAYGDVIEYTPALTLGQPYLGGIIAYFTPTSGNTHGLITTVSVSIGFVEWGCWNVWVNTEETYGSSPANTASIIATCPTPGIAARLCEDLVEGGYSDWYLPSMEELNCLYSNKNVIGYDAPGFYWSSSQSTSSGNAYGVNFYLDVWGATVKSTPGSVRPIRYF